mmetsp:Transcript_65868/g.182541  ORF Transcript_65868/g.182541 Transcript_65868/m.182541 type:complete len:691 (+) Transcript_65868:2-2074(+)
MSWWEQIMARARGDQVASAGQMPAWFRERINDHQLRGLFQQQMLQGSRQRQMIALQDRRRDTYHSNYKDVMRLKREASEEQDPTKQCELLGEAFGIVEDMLQATLSEAQCQPIEMLSADITLMIADAKFRQNRYSECISEARKSETVLRRCKEQRQGNVVVVRKKLAASLVLCGRAYLAQRTEVDARCCAEEAVKLGAIDLGELRVLLEESEQESDEELLPPTVATALRREKMPKAALSAPSACLAPSSVTPSGSSSPSAIAPPPPAIEAERWLCLACDEPNRMYRVACNGCGAARPQETAKASQELTDKEVGGKELVAKQLSAKRRPKEPAKPFEELPLSEQAISRCKKCHQGITGGKKAMRRHAKDECPKRTWECPECGDRMMASSCEQHPAVCRARTVRCDLCDDEMTAEELDHHKANECFNRETACDSCEWKGMAMHLQEHLDTCPKREVFCDHCYEAVPQFRMCSHECAFNNQLECASCMEPLGSRMPMVFLQEREDGRCVRSCTHLCLCQVCCPLWKERSATCPTCRTPFTMVAALADWLREHLFLEEPAVELQAPAVEAKPRRPKPVAPRPAAHAPPKAAAPKPARLRPEPGPRSWAAAVPGSAAARESDAGGPRSSTATATASQDAAGGPGLGRTGQTWRTSKTTAAARSAGTIPPTAAGTGTVPQMGDALVVAVGHSLHAQ